MTREIFRSEFETSQLLNTPGGPLADRVRSYVLFRHSYKSGGVIIFHSQKEQEVVTSVVEGLKIHTGEDKKHFSSAVDILEQGAYDKATTALEEAGFKNEKPDGKDYKLEDQT